MKETIIGKYLIIDQNRALQVFKILCKAWREKHYIYADVVLPEDQMKEQIDLVSDKISLAHWFLIAALPQRGGVMAEDPFVPLWAMFRNHPEMFDPKTVATKWSIDRIAKVIEAEAPLVGKSREIKKHALRLKMFEHATSWYYNMTTIHERFDDNVLNIFEQVKKIPKTKQFEAAFQLINNRPKNNQGIRGMRRKIFSLFIIWLQKEALLPNFPCPIPIDFHALRVMVATEIVKIKQPRTVPYDLKHMSALTGRQYESVSESLMDEVAKWTNQFLYRHRLSHMDLNPAIWVLSRELCSEHPQNTAYNNNSKYLFPEDLENSLIPDGLKTKVRPTLCNACLVEKHCSYVMPSKPYYAAGNMVPITRKKDLPARLVHPTLFDNLFPFKGNKHRRSKKQSTDIYLSKIITAVNNQQMPSDLANLTQMVQDSIDFPEQPD